MFTLDVSPNPSFPSHQVYIMFFSHKSCHYKSLPKSWPYHDDHNSLQPQPKGHCEAGSSVQQTRLELYCRQGVFTFIIRVIRVFIFRVIVFFVFIIIVSEKTMMMMINAIQPSPSNAHKSLLKLFPSKYWVKDWIWSSTCQFLANAILAMLGCKSIWAKYWIIPL